MFHETNFTNVLPPSDDPRSGKSPEAIIRDHINSLDQVSENYVDHLSKPPIYIRSSARKSEPRFSEFRNYNSNLCKPFEPKLI